MIPDGRLAGRVAVKICGITDAAGFDAACDADADWIGFNFFARSPRVVTPARAAALSQRRTGAPARVGLFVDPTNEEVGTVLAGVPLDALQVYAGVDRVRAIGARFGLPVWRAIGITTTTDLPGESAGVAGFVIESKPPPDATRPGGNAEAFDWSLTAGWQAPGPWLLAGGLTPDNVAAAIRTSGTAAVDVSSGVEQVVGVKSPALIRAFVAAARASLTVGCASPGEAEAVARAHVDAWHETYPGLLPPAMLARKTVAAMTPLWAQTLDAGEPVFVVRDCAAIVGVASAGAQRRRDTPHQADVRALYLRQSVRRRGYGQALMAAMARDLIARGLSSCTLSVLDGNIPAIRFYERVQGRLIGTEVEEGVTHLLYAWDDVSVWLHPPTAAGTGG